MILDVQTVMDILQCRRLWAYVVLDYLEQKLGHDFYDNYSTVEGKYQIEMAQQHLKELMEETDVRVNKAARTDMGS